MKKLFFLLTFEFCLLTLAQAQNVGIGNPAPETKLHIGNYDTDSLTSLTLSTRSTYTAPAGNRYSSINLRHSSNKWGSSIEDLERVSLSSGLNFKRHFNDSAGTSSLFIDRSNGRIGIGTTFPSYNLHIYASSSVDAMLEGSTGTAGNTCLYKARPYTGMPANTFAGFGGTDDGSSSVRAGIFVPNAANDDVIEAMSVLKTTGNVGIGTIAPLNRLHVSAGTLGLASILANIEIINAFTPLNAVAQLALTNSYPTTNNWAFLGFADSSGSNPLLSAKIGVQFTDRVGHSGDIVFASRTGVLMTEKMRILSNGNVGVGNTKPETKLHVGSYSDSVAILTIGTRGTNQGNAGNRYASINLRHYDNTYGSTIEDLETQTMAGLNFKGNFADSAGKSSMFIDRFYRTIGMGTTAPASHVHIYGTGSQDVMLESPSGGATTCLYKARTWNGTPTTTYVAFGGTDDGNNSVRASVYVPNAANNGVMEAMSVVKATGNVGIGTIAPNGLFELSLDQARKPSTSTWTITSDARLKSIDGAYAKGLAEILKLNPVSYHYKNAGSRKFDEKVLATQQVGFTAQEVQTVFPEAVGTDADGYLSLNIHPILIAQVNAIKEQQSEIAELRKQMDSKDAANKALQEKVTSLEAKVNALVQQFASTNQTKDTAINSK